VLEDDPRDWQKARRKLLSRSLADRIETKLKERGETVDWDVIAKIAHEPHGIPVAVQAGEASLEQLVAAAPRVRNEVPAGATWDGVSDLPVDEAEFRELLSDRDPQSPAVVPRKQTTP
jgi:hypothetical protein